MQLRRGKTKTILEHSIDCAILAVEIYNKPRAPFRVESYISNMIMAWTRLFHAHFHHTIGDKFYYKESNGRYKLVDGDRKAWELKTCIQKYRQLTDAQLYNLDFFIKLRNKIEHRYIDKEEVGVIIFGECQSLLYNYESKLIEFFGEEYALNESLAFALQFSRLRTDEQQKSSKTLLSKEVKELKTFIDNYKDAIPDETFNSQEYSIKLIQVPKISNTKKSDLAIEFVNWKSISEEDRASFDKITTIIKDKVVAKEVLNPGKLKPSDILRKVTEATNQKFTHYDHKCLYFIFSIRPTAEDGETDSFNTNTEFCHYDEVHEDYVFHENWVDFIVKAITDERISKDFWKSNFKSKTKINIADYK